MTLNIIADMRRELATLKHLGQAGALTPERFAFLTGRLEGHLLEIEVWLDSATAYDPQAVALALTNGRPLDDILGQFDMELTDLSRSAVRRPAPAELPDRQPMRRYGRFGVMDGGRS